MDDVTEMMQEYLKSCIGKVITVELNGGEKVTGILQNVTAGVMVMKTEKGQKFCKVAKVEEVDVLDDEMSLVTPAPTEVVVSSASTQRIPVEQAEVKASGVYHTVIESSKVNSQKPRVESEPVPVNAPVFDASIMREMLAIEAQLSAKSQNITLSLVEPAITTTLDLKSAKQKSAWNSIYNRYSNARKQNELAPRFGRIQQILNDISDLIKLAPTVAQLRRYHAYTSYCAEKSLAAVMKLYLEITYIEPTAPDWYNLAIVALMQEGETHQQLAYYALGRLFSMHTPIEYATGWYAYVHLLTGIDDHLPLATIYQAALSRVISSEEEHLFFEICVYLLKVNNMESPALELIRRKQAGESILTILQQATMQYFRAHEVHVYQALHQQWEQDQYTYWAELQTNAPAVTAKQNTVKDNIAYTTSQQETNGANGKVIESGRQLHGSIYRFSTVRGFGFIRGVDRQDYFFHRGELTDENLREELMQQSDDYLTLTIDVFFMARAGARGPIAYAITRQRDIQQIFELAVNYANDGEYEKANGQIKIVLLQNPEYPQARELYETWREFARARGLPRGSTPYARAKRNQLLDKDLENAILLFREAIRQNNNTESAIKDLAGLLIQLNRTDEAIEVLLTNRHRVKDQQSLTNLLVNCYQKAGKYLQSINLLRQMLGSIPDAAVNRKAQILWSIGNCYLRMEHYKDAEHWFREVIKLGANNKGAQRNLALCLLRLGDEEEAEKLLQSNLPDAKSAELLEAIVKARETGQSVNIEGFDTEVSLADFSIEISNFARFFLERSKYEGVDSQRRIVGKFDRTDVRHLVDLATKLSTRRPRERAEYYLSAAKIVLEHEDWEEEYEHVYKYLCRSFASHGDAAIAESLPVDTARCWYCEALSVYDGDRERSRDEQDATNAIIRFLFATVSRQQVPLTSSRENLRIDECLDQVLYPAQPDKIFHAIAYLVFRSQFAANRILTRLQSKPEFQRKALVYLESQGIHIPTENVSPNQFSELWKNLQLRDLEKTRDIAMELQTVASRIDFTMVVLESSLQRLQIIESKLFFDQDRRCLDELRKILELMLDLSQQEAFEEKERLCMQIEKRCQELVDLIEWRGPTKLAVESIYPIVSIIKEKTNEYLESTYKSSEPQITLRLPKDMESYSPDVTNRRVEVQIVIENKSGCSPAEAVELIIHEESEFFEVEDGEIKLEGSLRGGEQRIKPISIRVSELALHSQAFTLPVYIQYRTRSDENKQQTQEQAFTINLYAADQFERINNPYANYANGNAIKDEHMFYGRAELIQNIAEAIGDIREQSKGIVIYGQKRSGKSSILYHLKLHLQRYYQNLFIIDLGDIGAYLDNQSRISLLYQLLGGILSELKDAINDDIEDKKRPPLTITIPDVQQFYNHPTPLRYFQEILKDFKRAIAQTAGWRGLQIVLLIDEFTYLHGLIVQQRLSGDFMKNWKALLQENLFSVVLVGQDFMPKFKAQFPNEFAAIKDQRVSYLELEEARKLIDEPLLVGGKQGESRFREKAIERIIDLTAASPFYIQIFCDRLVNYMNRKRINLVTQADVEQVKNELIRGANALDEGNFDNLISSGDISPDAITAQDAREVLRVIAQNSRTGMCSRDRIVVETQIEIEVILQDLLTREVIEAKGQHYAIRVSLFKEWLNAH